MFLRKLQVDYEANGQHHPCPLSGWTTFPCAASPTLGFRRHCYRSPTPHEVGTAVPLDQLRDAMEGWFRRKGYSRPEQASLFRKPSRGSGNLVREAPDGNIGFEPILVRNFL